MIVSVSRRTDVPAFFGDWFIDKVQKGFVLVQSPYDNSLLYKVLLNPKVVDCFVFMSKNPAPFLPHLNYLDAQGYKYFFHFTLNPYDKSIEKNLPNKVALVETFKALSKRIGKEKVHWRYDPIIFGEEMGIAYHLCQFENFCNLLSSYTEKCFVSFLDFYPKVSKILSKNKFYAPTETAKIELLGKMETIAEKSGIELNMCGDANDYSHLGIKNDGCFSLGYLQNLLGEELQIGKDKSGRADCRCVEAVDVGTYGVCSHKCIYCYANGTSAEMDYKLSDYNPKSPILCGKEKPSHRVKLYSKNYSNITGQQKAF